MLKNTTKTLLGLSGFKEDYLGMFSVLLLLCWGLPRCNWEGRRETGSFQLGPGGRMRRALDVVVCVELAPWMEHAGIWEEASVANRESSLVPMLFASQRSLWWSHLWSAAGSEFLSVRKDQNVWFLTKLENTAKANKSLSPVSWYTFSLSLCSLFGSDPDSVRVGLNDCCWLVWGRASFRVGVTGI